MPGRSMLSMPAATLPICVSGTARITTSALIQRGVGIDAVDPEPRLQSLAAGLRQFDMTHLEAGVLEIGGEAIAHFSAGAEKCDRLSSGCFLSGSRSADAQLV